MQTGAGLGWGETGFVSQNQFVEALGDDWGECSGAVPLKLVVGDFRGLQGTGMIMADCRQVVELLLLWRCPVTRSEGCVPGPEERADLVIHGFWFGNTWKHVSTVTSSMQDVM